MEDDDDELIGIASGTHESSLSDGLDMEEEADEGATVVMMELLKEKVLLWWMDNQVSTMISMMRRFEFGLLQINNYSHCAFSL